LIVRPAALARRAALVVFLVAAGSSAMARSEGNLNLFGGDKRLKTDDWSPLGWQSEYGLMLAFGVERAPIHFAIDAFFADEEVDSAMFEGDLAKLSTSEAAIGVRKVWGRGATRPHFGAGASVVKVEEERIGTAGRVTNKDTGYGVWVDLGITWRLAGHLNLGVETRYSYADVAFGSGLETRDATAGGVHVGLLIGYGW
jgi:hypothetical protein